MRLLLGFVLCLGMGWGCTGNNVSEDDALATLFQKRGVQGSFALLDNGSGTFTVHNLKHYRDSAFSPGATFHLVQSLVGLQTGKIVSATTVVPWNGVESGRAGCNRDLNMIDALRGSCTQWFGQVAKSIGKDTLQHWLDSLSYGNKQLSRMDTFWLDNTLKIRPDEQMGFIKRLYFDQLPFFEVHQQAVKNALPVEAKPAYKMAYLTGEGTTQKATTLNWVMGWIEENNHPYFFVLTYESAKADANMQMQLLRDLLTQLDFFKGRR